MKHKVLIIDNYDSFTYNLIQIIEEIGECDCVIMKNDEIDFRSVDRYKKVLISPGPGVPSGKVIELIKLFSPYKSILGVCLGHQAIAEAFGGKLIRLPKVVHGRKQGVIIKNKSEYIFKDIPKEIDVGLYHSWTVLSENLPQCLRITASTSDGTIMALSHKQFDVKGIQFHPESIMTDYGKKILINWLTR